MTDSVQDQRAAQDEEHLNLLAVFHFVVGGFSFLGALIGLAQLAFLSSALADGPSRDAWVFRVVLIVVFITVVVGLVIGGLLIHVGMCLRRKTNRTLCIVVDCLLCLAVPLGTILGVLTIIKLTQPRVVEMFEGEQCQPGQWRMD